MFLLEAEDVNAVDLAMSFAPLLFRIEAADKQQYEMHCSACVSVADVVCVFATCVCACVASGGLFAMH